MSKYLRELVHIAQHELPQLQYDLQNASTLYTLQAAGQKMYGIVTYLVHEAIASAAAPTTAQGPQASAPAPIGTALVAPPPMMGGPAPIAQASSVTEVIMTAQGTKVIPPGGMQPAAMLPPGVAVLAEHVQPAQAPTPRPASPGQPAEIVLPRGGGFTPEVAAALAAARGQPAADATGGARNITNQPVG